MSVSATIPGLYYSFVRPPTDPSPLRTDVAGFFGRTQRGLRSHAIRVEGWREYVNTFGGLIDDAMTPYALRGYFDNGGQVAHVIRLCGSDSQTAAVVWNVGIFDQASGRLDKDWPGDAGFKAIQFRIEATSPGGWANETAVTVRYWAQGPSGKPEIELQISPLGETPELLTGMHPWSMVDEVKAHSAYVRFTAVDLPPGLQAATLAIPGGPRYREWGAVPRDAIKLEGGKSTPPSKQDYLDAVQSLGDEVEVALVTCPELYRDFPCTTDHVEILTEMLTQAEQLHDRLVIVDVPPKEAETTKAIEWVQKNLRDKIQDEHILRNGAVYHPRLLVPDPLGGVSKPLRCIPCSGLVTGVISLMDVQRGAYYTPANAPILEAVDLSRPLDANEQAALYQGGINLLRCAPGRGLLVWGGRVLGLAPLGSYVAHRRLIHLLVRAIRRVAEPLVFDTNGPELWLAFVRSITSVLMEAFRAGALKGTRPEDAFRVTCDGKTNPPEQIDQGIVVCEIQVAPAVPMEFITLRVEMSGEGRMEVFES